MTYYECILYCPPNACIWISCLYFEYWCIDRRILQKRMDVSTFCTINYLFIGNKLLIICLFLNIWFGVTLYVMKNCTKKYFWKTKHLQFIKQKVINWHSALQFTRGPWSLVIWSLHTVECQSGRHFGHLIYTSFLGQVWSSGRDHCLYKVCKIPWLHAMVNS